MTGSAIFLSWSKCMSVYQKTTRTLEAKPKHRPGDVWKTDEGLWRGMNPEGVAKSFEDRDKATSHAKGPNHEEDNGGHEEGGDGKHKDTDLKTLMTGFFKRLKSVPEAVKAAVKASPEAVQRFVTDREHRKAITTKIATGMGKAAKEIPALLHKATKAELKEIHSGVAAVKKVFKKPPQKLTKHDKKALYAVGAYVVSGTVLAASGGLGALAGGLGKGFAKHVAAKAVHHILDTGFTHFEVGESVLHGLHHFTDHFASSGKVAAEEATDDDLAETLVTYLYEAVRQVLAKGLTDEDMAAFLEGVNEETKDMKTDKKASRNKEAVLRARTIRLAYANPELRPVLLPLLKVGFSSVSDKDLKGMAIIWNGANEATRRKWLGTLGGYFYHGLAWKDLEEVLAIPPRTSGMTEEHLRDLRHLLLFGGRLATKV